MTMSVNIALLGRDFGWGGGVDFLRHVANGFLAGQQATNLKIYLLLPLENKIETPFCFSRVLKLSIKGSWQRKQLWFARQRPAYHETMLDFFEHIQTGKIQILYYENSNAGLLRCLRRINADVALPVIGTLGRAFPVPWVGYVYDFQHKYLPGNFSEEECSVRDAYFAAVLRDAAVVIVNSRTVKEDIVRFFPDAKAEVLNLPFSPNPLPEWFDDIPFDIYEKYLLPEKYFLVSNQFWIHKDHLTVFRSLVKNDINIVCTGTMEDCRSPDYMIKIYKFITENNLADRIRLLGHIPKRHQIEIMKKSVAVIQPTLFEGGPGGGCVYDAISIGVPIILSDISVNKEVEANYVWFFKSGDCEDLAAKIYEVQNTKIERPSQDDLMIMGQNNLEKLGNRLAEVVNCAIGIHHAPR